MQLVAIYKPKSEYARSTEEYVQNFKRQYPDYPVVLKDVDSVEGSTQAQLYDIMNFPALLVISNDGSLLNMWQGSNFPLMQEIFSYLKA